MEHLICQYSYHLFFKPKKPKMCDKKAVICKVHLSFIVSMTNSRSYIKEI